MFQLKDVLKTIWKGKIVILLIILVSIGLSFVVNEFLKENTYSTSLKLTYNFPKGNYEILNEEINEIVSTQNFTDIITSDDLMQQLIENTDLQISEEKIINSISINNSTENKLLTITIKGKNQNQNELILKEITELTQNYVGTQLDELLTEQIKEYEQKVESDMLNVTEAYNEFEDSSFHQNELLSLSFIKDALIGEMTVNISQELLASINNLTPSEKIAFIEISSKITNHINSYKESSTHYTDLLTLKENGIEMLEISDNQMESVESSVEDSYIYFIFTFIGFFLGIFLVLFMKFFKEEIRVNKNS
ncbi:Wzz/FepE/Etk N-terminal domain-containing protein [Gracilibacillus kekensis]|uniref:Chain length determinant protein n=1 Tax=Gracilibacillus kekensis TaxID=1027249 RepID=A0A1M7K7M5_9BACI|nr:Wzz/FepE/Etk N-terminal domain-containing protein [Gracilibacillus kekensis]SHM60837.1 Chain length determinant protein [Gracilibacillus kekensis]